MKKILLMGAFVIISSLSFADGNDNTRDDIIENRIEVNFMDTLGNEADIDVEIYGQKANVAVEYDTSTLPDTLTVEDVASDIADFIASETGVNDVFVTFSVDPLFGDDEIVYSETFKK